MSTDAHPDVPDGPWRSFADCPTCGAHRGFGCCDTTGSPGRLLGYAHPARQLDHRVTYTFDVQVSDQTGEVWQTVWSETCDGISGTAGQLAQDIWNNQTIADELSGLVRIVVWEGAVCDGVPDQSGPPVAVWPAESAST